MKYWYSIYMVNCVYHIFALFLEAQTGHSSVLYLDLVKLLLLEQLNNKRQAKNPAKYSKAVIVVNVLYDFIWLVIKG